MVLRKSSISWLKEATVLKIFLSSIKTEVAIKFTKKFFFFFFPAENRLGTERVSLEQPIQGLVLTAVW